MATMDKIILDFVQALEKLYIDIHLARAHDAKACMQRWKLQLIRAQLLNMQHAVLHNLRLHSNTVFHYGCGQSVL